MSHIEVGLRWPTRRSIELLHETMLAEHGGTSGVRDAGALATVLARFQPAKANSDCDIAQLAAAYGYGLIKNQAFVDGNKRAAFLGVGLFLFLNDRRLNASQVDATRTMLALAASEISEEQFAEWIRTNIIARM
jgi:death on curing protein